jgi:hypothetical protein
MSLELGREFGFHDTCRRWFVSVVAHAVPNNVVMNLWAFAEAALEVLFSR